MKALIKTFTLFLVLNSVTWLAPQKVSAQVSIDFQVFYDDLSPYGDWVDNPDYGYVWLPDVSSQFTPYSTNGYWVYTYAGWTWVSNYSWGWAPFHYGRWFYDSYYGWLWAPDNEWGPGWVTWRRSDDYYGWAPIGPGININIAYSSGYNLPYNQWTFVRNRDFGRTNITNYYISSSNYTTIINNSTVINNIQVDNSSNVKYNSGPDRTEVQRQTGTTFAPVILKEINNPGQNLSNGELQIYKPRVERNNSDGRKSAPSKLVSLKDVKPVSQKNAETQPQRNIQPTQQRQQEQQGNNQQANEQQQQRNDQQVKQQHQQRNDQQARQQQQQQRNDQQAKQQQQQQRNDQQAKQQQQQQRNEQQSKQQQQQQRNDQQAKQQQQQRNDQQAKQQQQQRNDQQPKQQQQKPHNDQPAKGNKRDSSGSQNNH